MRTRRSRARLAWFEVDLALRSALEVESARDALASHCNADRSGLAAALADSREVRLIPTSYMPPTLCATSLTASVSRVSMTFVGPSGSFERRWIVYAMLRDNVQHHLEGGVPTLAFEALHRLGDALGSGEVSVPAIRLRDELARAAPLLARPIADFAVSVRTRSVCTLSLKWMAEHATALASVVGWQIPYPLEGAEQLGDILGSFHGELLHITGGATDRDVVEALDT